MAEPLNDGRGRVQGVPAPLSIYLDLVRFCAAMVVFLGHVAGTRLTGGFLWQLGPYTGEAVTVFFVLSGFVIAYATDQRETSARSYLIARAARVYSVALPALLLTFALDAVGRSIRPDLYVAAWGYVADHRAWQFVSGLLFINRIWGINVAQGSNLAYWSLGCEVWYYVIFGVFVFGPRRGRIAIAAGILVLVGPLTALLFPLWLLGVLGYRVCTLVKTDLIIGWSLVAGSTALWIAYEASVPWHHRLDFMVPYRLHRPELVQDYIVGLLFAAQVIGVRMISAQLHFLQSFARPIRWTAGATFSLYLFHLPVAQFLASLVPWGASSWATRIVVMGGTFALVLALADVTERRKTLWRTGFTIVLGPRNMTGPQRVD